MLHVRRTDYAHYKGGKLMDVAYYRQALSILRDQYGRTNPVWIFSDDIAFCKRAFRDDGQAVYPCESHSISDAEELMVMSSCRDFIIANSSFSWWAAYLGRAADKQVIAPIVDQWNAEIYPESWIALNAQLRR